MPNTAKKPARKPPLREVEEIPDRVLMVMNELGWPERGRQARLAKACDLSEGQVSAIVKKKRSNGIQAQMVVRLAYGLGANPGWLLTGKGEMFGSTVPSVELRALVRREVDSALSESKSK